jgi:hypothetical protein
MYGNDPMIKRYADHLKEILGEDEWVDRREKVARRFYQSLVGEMDDPSGKGKFFNERDMFGWYLFLAEAFNEHPQNYEVNFGSRVLPIFARLGADLDQLIKIEGYEERVKRMIGPERSQPNGAFFEFLVANAYVTNGYQVAFHPEKRGKSRTHDIDASKNNKHLAVECKRMEGGEYHEEERQRMRELWRPACHLAVLSGKSSLLDIEFKVELEAVPPDQLENITRNFLTSGMDNYLFDDEYSKGVIRLLDLSPIQKALKNASWLFPGPQYTEMLLGSYRRYDNHLIMQKVVHAPNPHFIDDIELAVAARWTSLSNQAIDRKARDVMSKVVDAHKQLPSDVSGVIHIGFEALGGKEVEARRYEKIKNSLQMFDSKGKPLEAVLCNVFSPEASPTETWAMDETCIYHTVALNKIPLSKLTLVVPDNIPITDGVHW